MGSAPIAVYPCEQCARVWPLPGMHWHGGKAICAPCFEATTVSSAAPPMRRVRVSSPLVVRWVRIALARLRRRVRRPF